MFHATGAEIVRAAVRGGGMRLIRGGGQEQREASRDEQFAVRALREGFTATDVAAYFAFRGAEAAAAAEKALIEKEAA